MQLDHVEKYIDDNGDTIYLCNVRVPKIKRVGIRKPVKDQVEEDYLKFINSGGDVLVLHWNQCGACKKYLSMIGGPRNEKGVFFIETDDATRLRQKYDIPDYAYVPAFFKLYNDKYYRIDALREEVAKRLTE